MDVDLRATHSYAHRVEFPQNSLTGGGIPVLFLYMSILTRVCNKAITTALQLLVTTFSYINVMSVTHKHI